MRCDTGPDNRVMAQNDKLQRSDERIVQAYTPPYRPHVLGCHRHLARQDVDDDNRRPSIGVRMEEREAPTLPPVVHHLAYSATADTYMSRTIGLDAKSAHNKSDTLHGTIDRGR